MKDIKAWHFLPDDGCVQHDWREDGLTVNGRKPRGKRAKVKAGNVYRIKPPLALCRRGLHGSVKALDALRYARGGIVCRTLHRGDVERGDDKLCSSEREVLWVVDATVTLHHFAVWCATGALKNEEKQGRKADPRSWAAVEAKHRWLAGEINDQELAAAYWAAYWAAYPAVYSAAHSAVYSAAYSAVYSAAYSAAHSAVYSAYSAQNRKLTKMLNALEDK